MHFPLSFRQAGLSDAPAVAALVNSAYRGAASRKGWTTEADFLDGQRTDKAALEEILARGAQWILLAEHDRNIVGSLHLEKPRAEVCYLGMFAVSPERQSQGIGKRLVAEAERFARVELGCGAMRMLVISLRLDLIAWYQRLGYKSTGKYRPFPYGNERLGIPLRDDLRLELLEKRL